MDTTLSLNCGRRLSTIKGGKLNNKIVYLHDKRKKCCDECNKKCRGDCCDNCKSGCNDDADIDYCSLKDKGIFQQMPNSEKQNSDVLFVNGKRGAGKTHYVAEYLKQYIRLYPKNKIYLFSQCKKDDLLDDLITKRVDLEDFIEQEGLTPDEFPDNCCVLFDDIDMCSDDKPSKLRSKLFHLMSSLIQLSRKRDITVIQTSHLTTNHNETKHALNGCSSFTFFYGAVSHQIQNAMKIYLGLSKENIKMLLNLKNSRYCTIFTTVPTVYMTEKEMGILK
jgi:hypothetical protein